MNKLGRGPLEDASSVYMRILGQLFFLIFPHFSPFFQSRTTFQILLNILKNTHLDI